MNRKQLIEEAAKAILDANDVQPDGPEGDHGYYAKTWQYAVLDAEAALAVFEGAYANDLATSSERVKNRPDSSHVIPTECLDCGRTDGDCNRIIVTPTDDEREALGRTIWDALRTKINRPPNPDMVEHLRDAVLAAGFHSTVQGDSKDLRVAESPVQGEPTRDSEEHLRGRWSNGDPVHIITDGSNRHVAPNLNGATWIPGAVEPYNRYAEQMEALADELNREGEHRG